MKFEYLVVSVNYQGERVAIVLTANEQLNYDHLIGSSRLSALNVLGKERWELVGTREPYGYTTEYFMKRELRGRDFHDIDME